MCGCLLSMPHTHQGWLGLWPLGSCPGLVHFFPSHMDLGLSGLPNSQGKFPSYLGQPANHGVLCSLKPSPHCREQQQASEVQQLLPQQCD